MSLQLKRIYDEPSAGDGRRVLVDRIWPRGLSKNAAQVDEWLRDLGPSSELRKWFGHDPARWGQFRERYRAELGAADQRQRLAQLRDLASRQPVTILYGAKDREHNQAVVIAELLQVGSSSDTGPSNARLD
jgi:uncharacterized protein YeaO (DUF488 family)